MALYDAFVSYSHAKDKPIAAALQSVVQTLGKPWYRRRALRVSSATMTSRSSWCCRRTLRSVSSSHARRS